jgi:hypothetical protein
MGGKMVNAMIFEKHLSFLRSIKSVNAIKDACFSSPIGSDDGQHLSFSDLKTDA